MSLPESFMYRSPSPTEDEIARRETFLELVNDLDLPKHRVLNYDIEWILAHVWRRNPACEAVFSKIKELFDVR